MKPFVTTGSTVPVTTSVSADSASEKPAALPSVGVSTIVSVTTPNADADMLICSASVPPTPIVPTEPVPWLTKAGLPLALSEPVSQSAGPDAVFSTARSTVGLLLPGSNVPRSME